MFDLALDEHIEVIPDKVCSHSHYYQELPLFVGRIELTIQSKELFLVHFMTNLDSYRISNATEKLNLPLLHKIHVRHLTAWFFLQSTAYALTSSNLPGLFS